MFRNLLRPGNGLLITMSWVTDCIFFSLFWILGAFPLLTLGGISAALYDAVYRTYRGNEEHGWIRFFQVFRANWKAGIVPSVIWLILFFTGAWGMIQIWNAAVYGQISWAIFSAAALFALLFLGTLNIMFPMLSRFDNSLSALLRNTVMLALANIPLTLGLGFVQALSLFLCIRFIYPLFFLPALAALISSLFLEPMFKPFMPAPAEGEQKV